jgi:hypothetical protein
MLWHLIIRYFTHNNSCISFLNEEPPFLYNTSDYHTRRRYSGFIPDLIHIISERLHRPYRITLVPYEGYGVPDARKPGGWTGLIGDVISNVSDMIISNNTTMELFLLDDSWLLWLSHHHPVLTFVRIHICVGIACKSGCVHACVHIERHDQPEMDILEKCFMKIATAGRSVWIIYCEL